MKAFKNDPRLKQDLLKTLKHHARLDGFIQGEWLSGEKFNDGYKGCFYGCTMQTNIKPRKAFSEKYHIDLWYTYLTERIYEWLPNGEFQSFPVDAIEIVPVGFDFNEIKSPFFKALLEKQLECVYDEYCRKAIKLCINLFESPFDQIDKSAAESAESAARSARSAARSALSAESARSAARSALSARSAESARSAARSALSALSARSAARSALSALSAESARSAARSAALSAHYIWLRDTLLHLIKESA